MKKLLFMVLAIAAFAGCSKEDAVNLSEGDKITRSIEQINTPLLAVLQSYQFWEESKTFAYTEPNGKGEEFAVFDAEISASAKGHWQPYEVLSYIDNQFVKYIPMTKRVRTYHYYDFDVTNFENNTFTFTRNSEEYYLKVLAYDNNNLWIETNCYDKDKNYQKEFGRADSYPYVRILYTGLKSNSYPLDGWASEEEITPYEIEYPVKLPENFFEIAEGTPIWKQDVGYCLVYDRDKTMFNDNLVVNKGLGIKKYNLDNDLYPEYYWYKFVDGIFYQISYGYKNHNALLSYRCLTIKKCETPVNYLLGITADNQIIVSGSDYNALIKKPYSNNNEDFNVVECYYISEGSDADIEQIKQLYNNPDVKKEFCNF